MHDCQKCFRFRDQLYFLAKDRWAGAKPEMRRQMARMSAASAWGLGQWDDMDEYVCFIPRDTLEGAFYRAVMALHQDHFVLAQKVGIARRKELLLVIRCDWFSVH